MYLNMKCNIETANGCFDHVNGNFQIFLNYL